MNETTQTDICTKKKTPAWHLHKRLYDWVLHFAHTKNSMIALFCLSFAESSFFPVPPDVLLGPLALGNPKKWLRFAVICTMGSVFGGIFGYLIGTFLWAGVGNFFHDYVPGFARDKIVLMDNTTLEGHIQQTSVKVDALTKVIAKYPLDFITKTGEKHTFSQTDVKEAKIQPFTQVGALYDAYDWQIVAIAGFTPIPYKVITITAGVFKINFITFLIASALSRAARFFMVAGLFGWKGERMKPFIDKYFNLLTLIFVILLIGGFLAFKFIK
jgi:membrane protein YqaA with SNARE-associated domain